MNTHEPVLELKELTKDYGHNRGVFSISLQVFEGETMGYVGTNGSGKTTTVRHLMGFLKPDSGSAFVKGMNAWERAYETKRFVAYLPGEIAFPGVKSGLDFLQIQAEMAHVSSLKKMHELIERLQLDPTADLKRMSKGMKQKTALVATLMTDAPILLLDEPSTGLDPLIRQEFIRLIQEEQALGKTIFLSSQLFDEVETLCNRVTLIHNGRLISTSTMDEVHRQGTHTFFVTFGNAQDAAQVQAAFPTAIRKDLQLKISLPDPVSRLFSLLDGTDVRELREEKYDFERFFNAAFHTATGENND